MHHQVSQKLQQREQHSQQPPRPQQPQTPQQDEQAKPRLEVLQAKLGSVQEELLALVQVQAALAMAGAGAGTTGRTGGESGEHKGEREGEEVGAAERERRSKERLMALQEELLSVHEQLQHLKLTEEASSPKRTVTFADQALQKPGQRPGQGLGRGGAERHAGGAPLRNRTGSPDRAKSPARGPGASLDEGASLDRFRERSAKTPPRRAMVHDDTEPPPAEQPLRCTLRSLSLPWENLAFDLLFKVCRWLPHFPSAGSPDLS